jgi:hypothetical protein
MIKVNTPYKLKQGQDSVTFVEVTSGMYSGTYMNGSLTGVLKDNVLVATFNNTAVNISGIMELTFNVNGFEGRWKKGLEPGELKQKWNGVLTESREKSILKEDLKTGFHVYTDDDGIRYEGEWENGVFLKGKSEGVIDGEKYTEEGNFVDFVLRSGKTIYEDGSSDEGTFDEGGLMHGQGIRTWANGDFEEGFFKEGELLEGKAKITHEDGDVSEGMKKDGEWVDDAESLEEEDEYQGDFLNGIRHGKGKLMMSGCCYEGDFSNNMMHGKGVYTWDSGISYNGDFVNNNFHGEGVKTFPNEDYYKGTWKVDDFISGIAKVTYDSGGQYEGEMLNGLRNGKGKYTWQDGDYYEGGFVDGNFNGQGKLTGLNGSWKSGTWENDKFVSGNAYIIYDDGDTYEGGYVNGKRQGWGILKSSNGKVVEGKWEDDELTFSAGDVVAWKSGGMSMTVERVFYKGNNLVAECLFIYRGKPTSEEYDVTLLKHLKN